MTSSANQNVLDNEFSQSENGAFLAIMIVGLLISLTSLGTVLFSVWVSERNKADTLSLFALLSMDQITITYKQCDDYL